MFICVVKFNIFSKVIYIFGIQIRVNFFGVDAVVAIAVWFWVVYPLSLNIHLKNNNLEYPFKKQNEIPINLVNYEYSLSFHRTISIYLY